MSDFVYKMAESTGEKEELALSINDTPERYESLGLGRGVDVTDPQMWRHKDYFIVRKVNKKTETNTEESNILETEEGCIKEKYEREISTVATHQQKVRLSLEDPRGIITIGVAAQRSQSSSAIKNIKGTKVKTRTITFKTDFDDIPLKKSDDMIVSKQNDFEKKLYSWIRTCIDDKNDQEDTLLKLKEYLKKFKSYLYSKDMEKIVDHCHNFVATLGVTHYVSSIKLGATRFQITSVHSKQSHSTAGANIGGKLAKGGMSTIKNSTLFQKFAREDEIGTIDKNGRVQRGTENEAVIGYQIQPVYKLVHLPLLRMALQVAIKEYIRSKEDKSSE